MEAAPRRAENYDAIAPLIDLCKAGRLFDVQAWIQAGKPVNPPLATSNRGRKKSPLAYAIDYGFHSLVQVLLEGGASVEADGNFHPMSLALTKRRFDLVKLLVEHDCDARTVDMREVFATWDTNIMEYFVERGADVETGMPLAWALCNRIRTALPIFKRYRERFASFQEQANVALRHHCKEGNMKWVSLLIWAGADPLAPGEAEPNKELDPEDGGLSAVGFAMLYGRYDIFSIKKLTIPIDHPAAYDLLKYGCDGQGFPIIEKLLHQGLNPNDQEDGGCSAIQRLVERLEWDRSRDYFTGNPKDRAGDSQRARERMRIVHLLAKHGARWRPSDGDLRSARRSLLKMKPDYTVEFAWIMQRFGGCAKEKIESLVKTPTMKRHLSRHMERLREILDDWRDESECLGK
jgi:hypothetical protein